MVEDLRASYHEYLRNKVQPVSLSMLTSMLVDLPDAVEEYMVNYLQKWQVDNGGVAAEKAGSNEFDEEVAKLEAQKEALLKKKEALQKMMSDGAGATKQEEAGSRAGSCEPLAQPQQVTDGGVPNRSESAMSNYNENQMDQEEKDELAKVKAMQGKNKRAGVSAQAVSADRMKEWTKPVFEKPQEAKDKLRDIIDKSDKLQVLFGHLTDDAIMSVIDAMFPKDVAEGESIIKQGAEGDCFYIIDEGQFDIFVARPDCEPVKVLTVGPGACFGELALMYDAPRAATVTATQPGKTWALDRESFQMMLITSENTKKKEYEGFLEKVTILEDLTKYEMAQVSDLLEAELFDAGETIITQGEEGDKFFIIEDGEAKAYIHGKEGEIAVKEYKTPGDYFGEIALLTSAARKATVRATGEGCSVLFVRKDEFDRVLGPIKDILAKNIDKYPQYADMVLAAEEQAQEEAEEQRKLEERQNQQETRREGVSAQGVDEERMKNWVKPVHAKSEEATKKLKETIDSNDKLQVLFGHLTEDAVFNVIEAMFPKEVPAGESIIKQGEVGDNFYIVDSGALDVFIKRGEGESQKVLEYQPGSAFGELALMYDAPRAATVTTTVDCKLWALDRDTFQMLLVTAENTQKKEYEGFLESVPILADLTKYEREQLSDKLESELFDTGEVIINQGDEGEKFYILEDGEARTYIMGDEGEVEVCTYRKSGEYFGEISLLNGSLRAATVRATGQGCTVLSMSKEDFETVLGPIKEQLTKKVAGYKGHEKKQEVF